MDMEISGFPAKLLAAAESRNNLKAYQRDQEFEEQRKKYCKDHNENYVLDYEIRHNINMQDFGM